MEFSGEVITKWLQHSGDDRYMELMEKFEFKDDNGIQWSALAGDKINGASIPGVVWSVVGSPFIGDYRRASVLHDVGCDKKEYSHKHVHRMFYDAMICDGVSTFRAKYMYQAVRLFGPKWSNQKKIRGDSSGIKEFDISLLNQNLDLDIDQLSIRLDKILNE